MKYPLILMFLLFRTVLSAQPVTVEKGRLFDSQKQIKEMTGIPAPAENSAYVDVKGSPFYQDDWALATLVTKDGSEFTGIYTRLNVLRNRLHYLDSSGRELIVGVAVEQIKYTDATGKTVHLVSGSVLQPARSGWFDLLVNDTLSLIKGIKKIFEEHTSYGSATEYSINTIENYFVIYQGKQYDIKKASDLTKVIPAKKTEIEAHIKKNAKLSKQDLLVSTAVYCNTILN